MASGKDNFPLAFLLVFPSENREVDIAFRMCLEVYHQAINISQSVVKIVIEGRIVHQ